jgi:hypothetical protein
MSDQFWMNLFKAKENEYGIVYDNNTLVVEEDFTFKAGVPYKISLSKKTADSGIQYVSIRAVVNDWAIDNMDKFANLKHIYKAEKQIEAAKQNNNSNDIDL